MMQSTLEPVLRPLRRQYERAQSAAFAISIALIKFWCLIIILAGAVCWMLFVATAIYFYLYQSYVPTMYHTVPVHFDFTHTEFGPYAYTDLVHPQYAFTNFSALSADPPPPARLLAFGQSYDIELQITLPDSIPNQQLRMINVKADILHRHIHSDPNDATAAAAAAAADGSTRDEHSSASKLASATERVKAAASVLPPPVIPTAAVHHPPHSAPPPLPQQHHVESDDHRRAHHKHTVSKAHHPHQHSQPGVSHTLLATSLRSFTTPYRSALTRWAGQLLWLVPTVLTGWSPESTHRLTIPLFEQFVEHQAYPSDLFRLHLLPPQHTLELQLYDVQLSFHTRLRGVSYILYHWFVSSAVVTISILVSAQLFIAAALIIWMYTCCGGAEADAAAAASGDSDAHANGDGDGGGEANPPPQQPNFVDPHSGSGGSGGRRKRSKQRGATDQKSAPATALPTAHPIRSRSRTPKQAKDSAAATASSVVATADDVSASDDQLRRRHTAAGSVDGAKSDESTPRP